MLRKAVESKLQEFGIGDRLEAVQERSVSIACDVLAQWLRDESSFQSDLAEVDAGFEAEVRHLMYESACRLREGMEHVFRHQLQQKRDLKMVANIAGALDALLCGGDKAIDRAFKMLNAEAVDFLEGHSNRVREERGQVARQLATMIEDVRPGVFDKLARIVGLRRASSRLTQCAPLFARWVALGLAAAAFDRLAREVVEPTHFGMPRLVACRLASVVEHAGREKAYGERRVREALALACAGHGILDLDPKKHREQIRALVSRDDLRSVLDRVLDSLLRDGVGRIRDITRLHAVPLASRAVALLRRDPEIRSRIREMLPASHMQSLRESLGRLLDAVASDESVFPARLMPLRSVSGGIGGIASKTAYVLLAPDDDRLPERGVIDTFAQRLRSHAVHVEVVRSQKVQGIHLFREVHAVPASFITECVNNFETPVAGSLVSNAALPRVRAAGVLEG